MRARLTEWRHGHRPRHRRHRLHRPPPRPRPARRRARRPGDDPASGVVRRPGRAGRCRRVGPRLARRGAARRRRGDLPRPLPRRPRLRAQGRRGRAHLQRRGRRGRGEADRLHGRARRRRRGPLRPPALAPRGRGACSAATACRSRCCAPRSSSATAASRGRSPASWSRTCRRWSCPSGSARAPSRSRSTTWCATSPGSSTTQTPLGRVFEIGGPEQLTYREMMQVAAEAMQRPPDPDRRSCRCSRPGLSSYWLALVTDVDVTTGRNLIDSMSHRGRRARHLDPRRRAGRAADLPRVRASCAGRAGRCRSAGQKSRGSRNSIDSDHVMWVRIGARIPPLARRSRPQTVPSRTAAKASITLPVASVATT